MSSSFSSPPPHQPDESPAPPPEPHDFPLPPPPPLPLEPPPVPTPQAPAAAERRRRLALVPTATLLLLFLHFHFHFLLLLLLLLLFLVFTGADGLVAVRSRPDRAELLQAHLLQLPGARLGFPHGLREAGELQAGFLLLLNFKLGGEKNLSEGFPL